MTKEDRNKSFLLDAFNDYILEPSDDNLDLLNQMAKKYRNVWIQSSSNKREKENLEIANKENELTLYSESGLITDNECVEGSMARLLRILQDNQEAKKLADLKNISHGSALEEIYENRGFKFKGEDLLTGADKKRGYIQNPNGVSDLSKLQNLAKPSSRFVVSQELQLSSRTAMKNKKETAEMNLRESGESNKFINNIAKAEKIMQRAAKRWDRLDLPHDSRREINTLLTGLTTQITQLKPQITEYVDDDGQVMRHQKQFESITSQTTNVQPFLIEHFNLDIADPATREKGIISTSHRINILQPVVDKKNIERKQVRRWYFDRASNQGAWIKRNRIMKILRAMIRETRMSDDDPTEIQVTGRIGILNNHNHDDPRIENMKIIKSDELSSVEDKVEYFKEILIPEEIIKNSQNLKFCIIESSYCKDLSQLMNANFIDKSPKWRDVLIFNEDVLTFRSLSDDQISDLKTSKGDWYLSSQMPSFTNKSFREMVTLLIEDEKLRVRQMKQEGKTIPQISEQTEIDRFDIENYCRGLEDE